MTSTDGRSQDTLDFGGSTAASQPEPDLPISDVGEDALIALITQQFPAAPEWLRVPAGDDAAVLDLSRVAAALPHDGQVVVSTDSACEGVDFRLDFSSAQDIATKIAVANCADIDAMGAAPVALLISLNMPDHTPTRWVRDLAIGFAQEAQRQGAHIVGGDLGWAPVVTISAVALGVMPAGSAPVLRSGAQSGDQIALAGPVGWSSLGLALLEANSGMPRPIEGATDAEIRALAAHRRPQPQAHQGIAAVGATSLIDTSDGLVRDLRRIAAASAVRLRLDAQALTPSGQFQELAQQLVPDRPALEWVLAGAEDHVLAGTFPAGAPLPSGWRAIGRVEHTEGPGDVWLAEQPYAGIGGWQHFQG